MLLVGGSCRIPYVREAINRRFGRQPLLVDEPELAVCLGATIYGNMQVETQVKEAEQRAKIEAERQRREEEERKRIATPALKSARGVNYTKLRDLLEQQKWEEADRETETVIIQIVRKDGFEVLDRESIDNFPCEDLRIIDQLWVKYSKGRFGFSVQKLIYQSLGSTDLKKGWLSFSDCVGWRVNNQWLWGKELTYNLSAPEGHLPKRVVGGWPSVTGVPGVAQRFFAFMEGEPHNFYAAKKMESLFSRIETCNL